MKPICLPCRRFFRMRRAGVAFIEGKPIGNARPKPGRAEPHRWEPYKIWSGDVWECEGCGAQIISGTGQAPISERHDGDFLTVKSHLGDEQIQINDC